MVLVATVSNGPLGLDATVTVTSITTGPNAGCVLLTVENNSIESDPNTARFIGSICLDINHDGPFFVDGVETGGGNCPGGCLVGSEVIIKLNASGNQLFPGDSENFLI
ncbi:MAG TPA: hypothetical protein VEV44_00875, partial [Pseudoneobacillus sp.]|nr:hypothetical protein [Pseudoneobacillus sp.]